MNDPSPSRDPRPDRRTTDTTRPRRRRLRGLLINLLLIIAVFTGVQWWKARPLASGDAPPLAGTLTTREPFQLAGWQGEPVLVYFWATWCPICKMEEPSIDALSQDFNVVTVAMQSGGDAAIETYLRERGLDWHAIADPYGEIATRWGVRGVPTSFVLDGAGRIRFAKVGYTTGVGLRGRLWAAKQLD